MHYNSSTDYFFNSIQVIFAGKSFMPVFSQPSTWNLSITTTDATFLLIEACTSRVVFCWKLHLYGYLGVNSICIVSTVMWEEIWRLSLLGNIPLYMGFLPCIHLTQPFTCTVANVSFLKCFVCLSDSDIGSVPCCVHIQQLCNHCESLEGLQLVCFI